jgi:hypothetical protein
MLDTHGCAWPAVLRGVLAATSLDTGLFVGGDYELIWLEQRALPLAGI